MVNRKYDKWMSINAQQWLWADALFQCCLWHTWKVNHDKITRSIAATGSQLNAWVWTKAYNMEGQLWPQGYWLNYNQTTSEDELYKLCIETHLKCLWLHNVSTLGKCTPKLNMFLFEIKTLMLDHKSLGPWPMAYWMMFKVWIYCTSLVWFRVLLMRHVDWG